LDVQWKEFRILVSIELPPFLSTKRLIASLGVGVDTEMFLGSYRIVGE
jgi:hypothetical protein